MIGTAPGWVGDVTQILGLALAMSAAIGVCWRLIRPGFHASVGEVVDKVTAPKFAEIAKDIGHVRDELTTRIEDANDRLDAHTRAEEAQGRAILAAVEAVKDGK